MAWEELEKVQRQLEYMARDAGIKLSDMLTNPDLISWEQQNQVESLLWERVELLKQYSQRKSVICLNQYRKKRRKGV